MAHPQNCHHRCRSWVCYTSCFQRFQALIRLSGLIAYREFSQEGYDVHLFERDNSPGGNWHYTDETFPNTPVPNVDIAVGDFTPSLPPKGAKLPYIEEYQNEQVQKEMRRAHRSPKPIWASLKSNAPAVRIVILFFFFEIVFNGPRAVSPCSKLRSFHGHGGHLGACFRFSTRAVAESSTELPHQKLQKYIRGFASWHGVNSNDGNPHIFYNTRVESVQKGYAKDGSRSGWTLTVKELSKTSSNTTRATWTTQVWVVTHQVKPTTEECRRTSMRLLLLREDITRLTYQTSRASPNGRNDSLIESLTPASTVGQSLFPIKQSLSLVSKFV